MAHSLQRREVDLHHYPYYPLGQRRLDCGNATYTTTS